MNYNKLILLIIPFLMVSLVSALDLSDYPTMFIEDDKFNGLLVVGNIAPAEDVIGISDIAMSIQYQEILTNAGVKVSKIEVGATKIASEISNTNSQNLILVGRQIRDTTSGNSLIDNFYSGNPSGGFIKLVKNGNYYVLIVTGDTTQNVRKATKVLANYGDYDLDGMEVDIANIGEKPPCSDSDNGKNYYVKGSITGKMPPGFISEDKCISPENRLREVFCENDYGTSVLFDCPDGCNNGACIKKDTTKHLLAVDDKAPSSDVIILTDVGLFLKQNNYDVESTKLNSEVTKSMLDNKVTTFVYQGDVIIIVGSNSPNKHNTLAQDISNFLEDEKGIRAKIIKSSKIESNDLRKAIPGYTPSETEETTTDEEPDFIHISEEKKCTSNTDCDDNNACTTDTCSGTSRCSNTETTVGCNYNKKCISIGLRVFDEYCEIDKEVYVQKTKDEPCKNNYECISNLCTNDKCANPGLIRRILNWFKGITGNVIKSIY